MTIPSFDVAEVFRRTAARGSRAMNAVPRVSRNCLTLGLFSSLLFAVGCGPSGPDLVPVRGTLTLDGQPLGQKNVYFSPENGTPGLGAGGNTKSDGSFELLAVVGGALKDMKGAQVGSYRVVVSEPMFPIETELEVQGRTSGPEVAIGLPTAPKRGEKPTIPPAYSNKDTTPLKVQVEPGANDLVLELKSKG